MMGTSILSMPWALERVCNPCMKFFNRCRLYQDDSVVIMYRTFTRSLCVTIYLQLLDLWGLWFLMGCRILSQTEKFAIYC